MREIPLTFNKVALVDDEDYERLSQYKWRLQKRRSSDETGYAVSLNSPRLIRMHRFILNAPSNLEVDHINGNTLDNRKQNLRLATHKQNTANRNARGCYKYGNKWRAFAGGLSLGYFDTQEQARKAYDEAKAEIYGVYAWQNPS